MILEIEKPVVTNILVNGKFEPCYHNNKIEQIMISDEQILKIGKRYFELITFTANSEG